MSRPGAGLRLGFVEPHLRRYGGIRRMVEFANRLVARGHDVDLLPARRPEMSCTLDARATRASSRCGRASTTPLDVIVFNHEPQWHLLDRFASARRRVFYALHYAPPLRQGGQLGEPAGPGRPPAREQHLDRRSDRGRDRVTARPCVLGGVNREIFRPAGGPKRYPLLCIGDERRPVEGHRHDPRGRRPPRACRVEGYAAKNLDQAALGREYDAARVFVVGSWFEGFCQPGLEALACGVAARHHRQRRLSRVRDRRGDRAGRARRATPPAMADAIGRLLDDDELAGRLVANGLELVDARLRLGAAHRRVRGDPRRRERRASALRRVRHPGRRTPRPDLSVVVLAVGQPASYTQQFVESVRRNTDVPYELIIVDNGSEWEAANYAAAAADIARAQRREPRLRRWA